MSSDVAQQIGQFHSQSAQFGVQGSLISEAMNRTSDPQTNAGQLAGRGLNAVGAFGVPALGLGLGMAGLDPMSLGMKAFGAAGGMSRFGAALGAGAGVFGLASAGVAATSWAGGQVWQGAQQQQQFNNMMRSSFNFMTPQGQGFNNGQLGAMNQQMHSMASQIGPMGEMTSVKELNGLAANMGRMGMSTGVRDVQEFSRKFREMVDTAKTMARDLGTTLEGAQQTMQQMKSSGVFRSNDQMKMAGEMRAYSLGGNLAMSELTSMAGIGSQISRMVGGRGRAGAFAGVRTLGQVGMAQEAGILSEEDIYNSTGLTGADGRQAFAASQLQNSAAWLRNGKGRRFLASVAGANGQLDAGTVADWMSGDMSTGSTMGNAHKNLNKVGRADFIRNEGKLRGEALAQFGGNIPAMALMQWAGSRGIDVNTMNDREMLFAQRHTGLGMEELENSVKMIRNMPAINEQNRMTQGMDAYRKDVSALRKNSGIEGVKRSLEHTKEGITNKLQAVGSQMYTDLTSYIEDWLNKTGHTVMQQASADIDKAYGQILKGQGGGSAATLFGLGSSGTSSKGAKRLGADDSGSAGVSGLTAEGYNAKLPFGHSMADRVKAAGLGGFIKGNSDSDIQAGMKDIRSAMNGMQNTGNAAGRALGGKLSDLMRKEYAGGIAESAGGDRMSQVQKMLSRESVHNPHAKELFEKLRTAKTSEERYAILASAEDEAKIGKSSQIGAVTQLPAGLQAALRGGSGETDNERMKRYGDLMTGNKAEGSDLVAATKGDAVGIMKTGARALVASATMGLSVLAEKGFDYLKGVNANRKSGQASQYLVSKDGLAMSADILGGKDRTHALEDQINAVKGTDDTANNQREMLRKVMGVNRAILEANKSGGTISNKRLDEIAKEAKTDRAGLSDVVHSMSSSVREQQAINRREALASFAGGAQNEKSGLQRSGYLDAKGNISDDTMQKMYGNTDGEGAMLSRSRNRLRNLQAKGGDAGMDDKQTLALMNDIRSTAATANHLDYSMSIQDLRAHAKAERGAGNWGESQRASEIAGFRSRGERTLRARGGALGTASILGLKVGREDAKELRNAKDGDGKLASYLESTYGVTDTSAMDKELRQLEIAEKGGGLNVKNARRMSELKEQIGAAKAGDADVKDLIGKVSNAKTPQEKMEAIANLKSNTAFQEKEKEREHKSQMNDPNLRGLNDIKVEVGKLLAPLNTIAQNLPKPEGS